MSAAVDPTIPPSGTGCVECDAVGGWWVHLPTYEGWKRQLRALVENDAQRDQLTPGVSQGAVRDALGDGVDGAVVLQGRVIVGVRPALPRRLRDHDPRQQYARRGRDDRSRRR